MNLTKLIKDIPLYQKLYGNLLHEDLTEKDLEKLPILTKKEITDKFPDNWKNSILQKVIENHDYEFMTTSGTTEDKVIIIRPKNWWFEKVEKKLFEKFNNIYPQYNNLSSKAILTTAICSNTICYKEYPPYEQRIINGILHLNITLDPNKWTKEDIQRMVEEINKFQPYCLQADPVYLSIFFKLLNKYQVNKPKWTPLFLLLTYEFCPKKCLSFIKSFWDIPTHIIYGTTETGAIFFQKTIDSFNWINDDNYIYCKPIENKPNYYEILITSFRNSYMPLVNFQTGDIVYSTSHNLNLLDSKTSINQFMGRERDITYSFTNEIITTGDIDNLLSSIDNNLLIYQLDFINKEKLIFKFTTYDDNPLTEKNKKTIKEALHKFYKNLYIEFEHLDEILAEPSGKFNIVKK